MRGRAARLTFAEAEAIGLKALAFLAEDGARLARFLALTGMDGGQLRALAGHPETLAAVLDHVLHDESLLLAFTANHGLEPASIAPAHALLSSGHGGQ